MTNPKQTPLLRCPQCFQPWAHYHCTKTKCREPQRMRGRDRTAKAYLQRSKRLTIERKKYLVERQMIHDREAVLLETHERRLAKNPPDVLDRAKKTYPPADKSGWLRFPGSETSVLHDLSKHPWEGVRQVTEHWVSAPKATRDDDAMIQTARAVRGLMKRLKADRLNAIELDREISRICQSAPPQQSEAVIRWIILEGATPWHFYPWSIEVKKLIWPHPSHSEVTEISLQLRPGISKCDAQKAVKKLMELKMLGKPRLSNRSPLPLRVQAVMEECFQRFDGQPNHIKQTKDVLVQEGLEISDSRLRVAYRNWKQNGRNKVTSSPHIPASR